jgi:hypothetical protein
MQDSEVSGQTWQEEGGGGQPYLLEGRTMNLAQLGASFRGRPRSLPSLEVRRWVERAYEDCP